MKAVDRRLGEFCAFAPDHSQVVSGAVEPLALNARTVAIQKNGKTEPIEQDA